MQRSIASGKTIDLSEIEFEKVSADPCGRVFRWDGRLFRAINVDMTEGVRNMFTSGMIDELVDKRLFPQSWITDYSIDGYGLVVEHEKIPNVSYPFEWSFSMLKDAAITVLKTNKVAGKYGYQTKDCHTYNICFHKTTPLFVDLGSFVRVNNKRGWTSYQDFLKFYYYPLKIWSSDNSYFARKMLFSLSLTEDVPHESYLRYRHSWLRLLSVNWLKRIIFYYFAFKNRVPFNSINFERLIRRIRKISMRESETAWGEYHNEYYDEQGEPVDDPRFLRIIEIIREHDIRSVTELGGNQGIFAEMLLKSVPMEAVICTDYDERAVDLMYLNAKKKELSLTPVVVDIMFPLMNYYETPPYERFKSDAVLALAVTHHLVLSQHISVELVFEIVARYTKKYVFIEFMPLGLWGGETAPPLPPWYDQDWFKTAFEKAFKLHLIEQLDENRVLFLGEIREAE